ncbi:unnamed protein product [Effrenium voratum]|nr:unnamed protein product [Effrenium voratum]
MEIYPELKRQRKMTCFVREMSVGVQELDVMKEKLSYLKYRRRIEPWKTRSEPEEETPAHLQGPGAEAVENNARLDGVPGSGFGPARSTGVSSWRNNAEAPYFNEVFFDFEGGKETEVTKVTNDYWIYDQVFEKMENVDEKGVGFNGRRLRMENNGGDQPLTSEETSVARSVCGALNWAGKEGRPDASAAASMYSSKLKTMVVSDLLEINKVVKRLQENAGLTLQVQKLDQRWRRKHNHWRVELER